MLNKLKINNLRIRTKLGAILVLPLFALLVLATVGFKERSTTATRARHDTALIRMAQASSQLAAAYEREGTYAVAASSMRVAKSTVENPVYSYDKTYADPYLAAQKQTDQVFKAFDDEVKQTPQSILSDAAKTDVDSIRTRFESVKVERGQISSSGEAWGTAAGTYDTSAGLAVTLVGDLASSTTSPEVVAPLQQLQSYLRLSQATTNQGNTYVGSIRQGTWDPNSATYKASPELKKVLDADQEALQVVISDVERYSDIFQTIADRPLVNSFNKAGSNAAFSTVDSLMRGEVQDAQGNSQANQTPQPTGEGSLTAYENDPATTKTLVDGVAQRVSALQGVSQSFADQLRTDISGRQSSAIRSAQLYVLFAGLVILLAVLLAFVVARSITLRVHKLTTAADRLSHEQLPRLVDSLKNPAEDDVGYLTSSFTEIDVRGTDEIGHLSTAFNRIQGVAVEVATEQAQLLRKGIGDMFVNLARRNQGLLDRQIEFIDQLESAEEDPDQLENLFRLDHLATRMRRNAESLLVLAGAEPNRRRGKPVPLADVVRAAVGEVEDFARIDMLQFDEVLIASNAALDVAHLLSELMENAANFSPPDSRVEVVGHRTKAEGYVISVADHGIGMTPEQLSDANDLLARPPLVGLALSRSLGFIVIGRLASRFGIAVRLMPSPSGGSTAMVSLPPALITDQPRSSMGPGAISSPQDPSLDSAPDDASSLTDDKAPLKRGGAASPPPNGAMLAAEARVAEQRRDGGQPPSAPPRREPPKRTPGASAPPPATRTITPVEPSAPAVPATPATPDVGAPGEPLPAATGALTKRVPRSAGGDRAVPGGSGERAATKNRRSPEEVRSMLSRYRSGIEKGRADDGSSQPSKDDDK